MAQYCSCKKCTGSVAQPKVHAQANMELIQGGPVVMRQGWMLAHWSAVDFTEMKSTEIHNFVTLGYKYRVAASFYLYTDGVPDQMPKQLRLMGLGGDHRYTISPAICNRLRVFYKVNRAVQLPEVTVILGCDGEISFNAQKQATAINVNDSSPILTIRLE